MTRAAFLAGPRRISLGTIELPAPGPGEARVAVAACGVCGTNLDGWSAPDKALATALLPGAHGHEVAGIVSSVGPGAGGLAVGDRVCLEPNLALQPGPIAAWGFADSIVAPVQSLLRLPDGLDLELATLAEPLASAIHGLRGSFTAVTGGGRLDGVSVAVIGAGVLGLLTVAAAVDLGGTAIAVARHPHQAKAAAALGASDVLDSSDPETIRSLRKLRPRLVVEAVGGASNAIADAFAAVAPDGEIVIMGLFDGPRELDVTRAVFRNVRAFFALAYGERDGVTDFELALRLLAARPADFGRLLTHRLPLGEAQRAFELAADKSAGTLRVLVTPRSG